ncbi:hypothetical protein YB2330_002324 [Saitoella coloradoensis]
MHTPSRNRPTPRRERSPASSVSNHLYTRGFLEGACSDIAIVAFGKTYRLHRLVLDRSPFFSAMFGGPWSDATCNTLDLTFDDPNITQIALECALGRLYGHQDHELEEKHVMGILATANYLGMQELVEVAFTHILRTLTTSNVAGRLAFATGSQFYGAASSKLDEACRALLFREGWSMGAVGWDGISAEVVYEIVRDDMFWVPNEWERFIFAKEVLEWRMNLSKVKAKDENEADDTLDVAPLRELLNNGVYYTHMLFEQLHIIAEMKDTEGREIVSKDVIQAALWDQMTLRQRIQNTPADSPAVGLAIETPPSADSATRYPVATDSNTDHGDSTTLDSPEQPASPSTWSPYPPFRFSAEFKNVRALKEDKRVYSKTVFYAGSQWNVYIQKVRTRKNVQLGVYLHRARDKEEGGGSAQAVSLETRILEIEQEMASTSFSSPRRRERETAAALGDMSMGGDTTIDGDTTMTAPKTAADDDLFTGEVSTLFPNGNPYPSISALPAYTDSRPTIHTYFRIICARKGKNAITVFNSAPDKFNFSQSWGWKTSSLCSEEGLLDEVGEGSFKVTLVLGNV